MPWEIDILAFLEEALPGGKLDTKGEYWHLCPFHAETTPSFSVNIERGVFKCLGCGRSGSLKELAEELGWDWEEVLAQFGNGANSKRYIQNESRKVSSLEKLKQVWKEATASGKVALSYLQNRGLSLKALPPVCREFPRKKDEFWLLIAGFNQEEELVLLQRIELNGKGERKSKKKPFFKGSRLKGSFSFVGLSSVEALKQYEGVVGVAEGLETALAVHLATQIPVIIAFSATNLPEVFIPPKVKGVVVFADFDPPYNTGEIRANELKERLLKKRIPAIVVLPPDRKQDKKRDFLDTYNNSPSLVKEAFEQALKKLQGTSIDLPRNPIPESGYYENEGEIWIVKNGELTERLTNFIARIKREVLIKFETGEPERVYEMEVFLRGKSYNFVIKAKDLLSLDWIEKFLGAEARVLPKQKAKFLLADAIKELSNPEKISERGCSGWIKIGKIWKFVTPGERAKVILSLGDFPYEIIDNPSSKKAGKALFYLLKVLQKPSETLGLLAWAFLPPLTFFLEKVGIDTGLSFCLYGTSGSFKTTISRLFLTVYGTGWLSCPLPGALTCTLNHLLTLGFHFSYLPLLFDDIFPPQKMADISKTQSEFSQLVRIAGNRAYRGRLRVDGTFQAEKPFKATPLFTTELLPSIVTSAVARLVLMESGDKDLNFLAEAQESVDVFPHLGSLWLNFLGKNHERVLNFIKDLKREALTQNWLVNLRRRHPRTAQNFFLLWLFLRVFQEFVKDGLRFESAWVREITQLGKMGLSELIRIQNRLLKEADPVLRFRATLRELLDSETVRLATEEEREIDGKLVVGFVKNDRLYLYTRIALQIVNRTLSSQGLPPLPELKTFYSLLEKEGWEVKSEVVRFGAMVKRAVGFPLDFLWFESDREEIEKISEEKLPF